MAKGAPWNSKAQRYEPTDLRWTIQMAVLAVFVMKVGLVSAIASSPILPEEYRGMIGQGFATNWFKTDEPLSKYHDQNIDDIYARGFRNVRLRSRADLYAPPYTASKFKSFLGSLTKVVDYCLDVGVVPIISWIHHHAEAYASDEDRKNYVQWWKKVAKELKDRDYRLSFNLFTELGIDGCGGKKETCGESLRMRRDKYNRWTKEVVAAIRATGGNNEKRILILGSPGKTAKELKDIDKAIYQNDPYMMAEWHIYASGPNKKPDGAKFWSGNGIPDGRKNVDEAIKKATDFTSSSNLLTYLGAWMPTDNKDGDLNEKEVIQFARYFASALRDESIPWSLNVLDRYYDTAKNHWLIKPQNIQGQSVNMNKVLNKIKGKM